MALHRYNIMTLSLFQGVVNISRGIPIYILIYNAGDS